MNPWHQIVVLGRLFWAFIKCVMITMDWTLKHGIYIGVGAFFCWLLGASVNVKPDEPFVDFVLGAMVLIVVFGSGLWLDSWLTDNNATRWLIDKIREIVDGNSSNPH